MTQCLKIMYVYEHLLRSFSLIPLTFNELSFKLKKNKNSHLLLKCMKDGAFWQNKNSLNCRLIKNEYFYMSSLHNAITFTRTFL